MREGRQEREEGGTVSGEKKNGLYWLMIHKLTILTFVKGLKI
jgi:hypothetical protein